MYKFKFLLALVIATIQLIGYRVALPTPAEQDDIAIYQTVIRRIYESDDTFGGTLEKPTLYIIRATDDAAGDPSIDQ